ncbi:hypothetical protein LCGC14_0502970 [marine sediment metagenome]|uniref:Uncharacterized protein n=1 Tax=marine sediment metagenome TaxID=412755 RepID=A0A0F9S8J5_9ZZZZ
MPIVRIPDPNALPTIQNDFVRQNNKSAVNFLQVNKPIWDDATNIVQGAIFQIGGTVYYCNASTAIGGAPSAYIKLTPSGDGSIVTPTYVADLTGVSWNNAYNGYYDVGGNAYIFDELIAIVAGEIVGAKTRLWRAFQIMLSLNVTFTANPIFSGDPTFSGNATFDNGIIANGGITEHSITYKDKIMDIGDWNMNLTGSISIAHGLNVNKIRSVLSLIQSDSGVILDPDGKYDGTVGGIGHYVYINGANVSVVRRTGSVYDISPNYNAVSPEISTRGWIVIKYVV